MLILGSYKGKSMSGPKNTGSRTPKKLKTSIRFDSIHPSDYLKYSMPTACEQCTHFDPTNETCTLGYNSVWHRHHFQIESYELLGKIAFCRFLEID